MQSFFLEMSQFLWEFFRASLGKFGQKVFTLPKICLLLHLCTHRLSLSYQRIPSWNTVTKLARPSDIMAMDTSCCTQLSHIRNPLPSWQYPLPYSKNTKLMHILIGLLDRTLRQNQLLKESDRVKV